MFYVKSGLKFICPALSGKGKNVLYLHDKPANVHW